MSEACDCDQPDCPACWGGERTEVRDLRGDLLELRAENARLVARVEELEKGLSTFHPRNATERYELAAEEFYRRYGRVAPGKSRPMEMGADPEPEETLRLWSGFLSKWWGERVDIILARTPSKGNEGSAEDE